MSASPRIVNSRPLLRALTFKATDAALFRREHHHHLPPFHQRLGLDLGDGAVSLLTRCSRR